MEVPESWDQDEGEEPSEDDPPPLAPQQSATGEQAIPQSLLPRRVPEAWDEEDPLPAPRPILPGWQRLPHATLRRVLAVVSTRTMGFSHALVCRSWHRAAVEAQGAVTVRRGAALLEWDLLHLPGLSHLSALRLSRGSVVRLSDRLLAALPPGLEELSVEKGAAEPCWSLVARRHPMQDPLVDPPHRDPGGFSLGAVEAFLASHTQLRRLSIPILQDSDNKNNNNSVEEEGAFPATVSQLTRLTALSIWRAGLGDVGPRRGDPGAPGAARGHPGAVVPRALFGLTGLRSLALSGFDRHNSTNNNDRGNEREGVLEAFKRLEDLSLEALHGIEQGQLEALSLPEPAGDGLGPTGQPAKDRPKPVPAGGGRYHF